MCVYLSTAGIKLAIICVCMLYVVISLYTGRQLNKMLMDTRNMTTALRCILHFEESGQLTLLHVKKLLIPPVVLPRPQTG